MPRRVGFGGDVSWLDGTYTSGAQCFQGLSRFGVGCVGFLAELSFSYLHVHARRVLLLPLFFFFLSQKNLHNLHSDPKPAECLGFLRVGLGQNPSRTCTEPALGCRSPGRLSDILVCGLDAGAAIAAALGVPESDIELREPV